MNTTTHRKHADVDRHASPARLARAAEAARTARMVLQDEVRARLDQERAMRVFRLAKADRLATWMPHARPARPEPG